MFFYSFFSSKQYEELNNIKNIKISVHKYILLDIFYKQDIFINPSALFPW